MELDVLFTDTLTGHPKLRTNGLGKNVQAGPSKSPLLLLVLGGKSPGGHAPRRTEQAASPIGANTPVPPCTTGFFPCQCTAEAFVFTRSYV